MFPFFIRNTCFIVGDKAGIVNSVWNGSSELIEILENMNFGWEKSDFDWEIEEEKEFDLRADRLCTIFEDVKEYKGIRRRLLFNIKLFR